MRFKAVALSAPLFLSPFAASAFAADPLSGSFTVQQQTLIPGQTLAPGSYKIRVVDHLEDRYILRVTSQNGAGVSTFIGVQDPKLETEKSTGMVPWTAGPNGTNALRGYSFGVGEPALEFVYPKADAVAIAKVNSSKVPAIDPVSEGKSPELSGLSKDDMTVVSLWALSATQVGPNDTGGQSPGPQIKAEHLQQQVASARPPKPVIAKLPHTASALPLVEMTGLLSLTGAAMLGERRRLLRAQAKRG